MNSKNSSANSAHDTTGVVLLLQVPRTNDKKELAAEQMFASLNGLLTLPSNKFLQPPIRERISFEIAVRKKRIGFYVWVPMYLKSFVEEQIYAQYPTVQISEVLDYAADTSQHYETTLATELKLIANDALPIKTFQSFEVDPLAAITATLAKFEDTEEAWMQMVIKPASSQWHKRSERYVAKMRNSSNADTRAVLRSLWSPATTKTDSIKLTEYEQARASGAEEKSHKLAFEASVRIIYRGHLQVEHAMLRMQSIVASYKQFNTTYMNGFDQKRSKDGLAAVSLYEQRSIPQKGLILNIEEVATLYHLPHTTVETPYILWAPAQTAEPPANLPVVTETYNNEISPVAVANFRGHNAMFGMPRQDRGRHMYVIGQTGVGKSAFLELLTISDIYAGVGFAIIDPHGDYALNILRRIPVERAKDVIYFNPADTAYPIAFNPMEVADPKLKTHTVSELIGVLKRMFDSWGPRLEYILRYSLLALLDMPDATMLDITRILTDKKFRQEVLSYVSDPVVRSFWEVEFASWNDKFAAEAVAPVLNKVGAFTANPLVRNIIGQPKSSFNIRQIMDDKKILIVNLSRGLVGEDNASLLGSLLVTKIQLAAMSRADIHASDRHPFYLYVDEFQNFATDSFATILSEARKYGLNLTVANQYIAQMSMEVKDAVFGNVGTIVAFRMGADDARVMLRYFEPRFLEHDLVHMHNRYFVVSMTIEGEKMQGFSAISLNLPENHVDNSAEIIEHSRQLYSVQRSIVEDYVGERYLVPTAPQKQVQRQAPPKPAVKQVAPLEAEIINTPEKPHAVAAHKVVTAVTNAINSVTAPKPVAARPQPADDTKPAAPIDPNAPPKPKRKRTRKRKKSAGAPAAANPAPANTDGTQDMGQSGTIKL
ncbi:MAG: hypothetical protein JWN38_246 [Candidatus Saccharibacteria bacterium]|nr:hypothetical protein [Candidatus Saccharibacteria bacterium]